MRGRQSTLARQTYGRTTRSRGWWGRCWPGWSRWAVRQTRWPQCRRAGLFEAVLILSVMFAASLHQDMLLSHQPPSPERHLQPPSIGEDLRLPHCTHLPAVACFSALQPFLLQMAATPRCPSSTSSLSGCPNCTLNLSCRVRLHVLRSALYCGLLCSMLTAAGHLGAPLRFVSICQCIFDNSCRHCVLVGLLVA
jgi:hypothetical protein